MSKIFTTLLIKNRISRRLDENQGREQAGLRKYFSTVDQIFTLNHLIEKANEYNFEINLMLIDFKNAFDSINHEHLWEAIKKHRVPPKWIRITIALYEGATASLKTNREGEEFYLV